MNWTAVSAWTRASDALFFKAALAAISHHHSSLLRVSSKIFLPDPKQQMTTIQLQLAALAV
jgi:hypothetical protein